MLSVLRYKNNVIRNLKLFNYRRPTRAGSHFQKKRFPPFELCPIVGGEIIRPGAFPLSTAALSSSQQFFNAGFEHHLAGRLAEADRLYRVALADTPDHADSLHLRGLTLHQVGRQTAALPLMRRALSLQPHQSSMWSNLGDALRADNDIEQGAAAMKRALILEPAQANANHNLGLVQQHLGQDKEARRLVDRAIAIDPDNATFYYTLAGQSRLTDPEDPLLAAMEALARSLPDTALNDLTCPLIDPWLVAGTRPRHGLIPHIPHGLMTDTPAAS